MKKNSTASRPQFRIGQGLATTVIVAASLVFSSGCSKKSKAEDHKKRAESYYAEKEFAKAEIEYLNVLKQDRANVDAIKRLAAIYFDQGKIQQALPYMLAVRELDKSDFQTRIRIGQIFLAAGRMADARKEAIFVNDQAPDNEEALTLLADSSTTPEEIADSRTRLGKTREAKSSSAVWHLAMAGLALKEGNLPAAESGLKKAEELDPKSSRVHLSWAVYYFVQKDIEKAGNALKTAVRVAPTEPLVHLRYAEYLTRAGMRKEGREVLEGFVAKVPGEVSTSTALAKLEFEEGRLPECEKLVDQLIAKDSGNYQARLLRVGLARQKAIEARRARKAGDVAPAKPAEAADEAVKVAEEFRRSFEKSSEAWFELALAYLNKRDMAKTGECIQEALKLEPSNIPALLLQAELHTGNGAPEKAIPLLESILSKYPDLQRAQLLLGGALASTGRLDEALALYSKMEQKFPKVPDVPFLIGMTHRRKPDGNAEARKAFERAALIAPGDALVTEQLVYLDILDKKYEDGIARVKAMLERRPDSGNSLADKVRGSFARHLEARIHLAQGKSKDAEVALKQAIELYPEAGESYALLTNIFVAEKRLPEALANLDASLQKNERNVQALMQKALIFDAQGDRDRSFAAYVQVLNIAPEFVPALNNLAVIYSHKAELASDGAERLKLLKEAMGYASRANSAAPQEAAVADTLGWIHYQMREYPRALALLQESAAKIPDNLTIQYHLGMAYYMSGQDARALPILKAAVDAKGDFPERAKAEKRVSILALSPDASDEATVTVLKSALSEQPDDAPVMLRLGRILERTGSKDKALELYKEAQRLNPASVAALAGLARLYSEQGPVQDMTKAVALAKDARKLSPDDPEIAFLLGGLAASTGDHQWATDLLNESLRKQPGNIEGVFQLALSTYAVGRISEGEEAMKRALAQSKTAEGPSGVSGGGKLNADKIKKAEAFLAMVALSKDPVKRLEMESNVQATLASEPAFLAAQFVSGQIHEQRGRVPEARQVYERLVATYPRFAPARMRLGAIFSDHLGDQKKALEHAMKARESLPDDIELAKILGRIAFRQSDFPTAIRILDSLAMKLTEDSEVFYFLGMAHFQRKAKAEATQALEKCLSLAPEGPFSADAKKTLELLKK